MRFWRRDQSRQICCSPKQTSSYHLEVVVKYIKYKNNEFSNHLINIPLPPGPPLFPSTRWSPFPLMLLQTNNNFKMLTQKLSLDEQETELCSPCKMGSIFFPKDDLARNYISVDKVCGSTEMSQTQADLYSREIVKNIIQLNKNKTIKHEINQISKESQLYAKPSRYSKKEFRFNSIPPQNPQYASSCSAKIKQIDRGLQNKSTISEKTSNQSTTYNSLTSSQRGRPRISVSGLVTCKFNSVNAQRSLGFNQIDHEQRMRAQIKQSQKMAGCTNTRYKSVLHKTSQQRHREYLRQEKSINSSFDIKTQSYLKQYKRGEEQEMLIYGSKAKKLNFIKEYMRSEKTNYEQGKHIVDEIERFQSKQIEPGIKVCKTEVDEDQLLKERIMPTMKRRIKIRFLTFVD